LRKTPFLLFLLPAVLFADEVYLKGAGTISGRIVEQTATMVTVDIGGGVMGVQMSNVDHIVKARTALDDYDERASRLGPQDVNGWRELGRWATQQGLNTQERQAYQKVLAIAPNDAEANEALGLVLLDGRWVTEEEGYRARGYVKYDGEWMTSAEAQSFRESAAADQAREDAGQRAREADTDRMLADSRAEKAAEQAGSDQARQAADAGWSQTQPVYWGGWGYGMTGWPSPPVGVRQPIAAPARVPSRVPR
jgi:hypothetical protein